jgi:hypothetical protein
VRYSITAAGEAILCIHTDAAAHTDHFANMHLRTRLFSHSCTTRVSRRKAKSFASAIEVSLDLVLAANWRRCSHSLGCPMASGLSCMVRRNGCAWISCSNRGLNRRYQELLYLVCDRQLRVETRKKRLRFWRAWLVPRCFTHEHSPSFGLSESKCMLCCNNDTLQKT